MRRFLVSWQYLLSLLEASPQPPFFQPFHAGIYALDMDFYGDLITNDVWGGHPSTRYLHIHN